MIPWNNLIKKIVHLYQSNNTTAFCQTTYHNNGVERIIFQRFFSSLFLCRNQKRSCILRFVFLQGHR